MALSTDVPGFLSARALTACNAILNVVDSRDRKTYSKALSIAHEILSYVPSTSSALRSTSDASCPSLVTGVHPVVWSIGHCHIDTVSEDVCVYLVGYSLSGQFVSFDYLLSCECTRYSVPYVTRRRGSGLLQAHEAKLRDLGRASCTTSSPLQILSLQRLL